MKNYSSDQLRALIAGELSSEQESEIANAIEHDPVLLKRMELLSGSGEWQLGSAPTPIEAVSPSLESAIERVIFESRIEHLSTVASGSEPLDLGRSESDGGQNSDSLHFAIAVPGIRIVREIGRGGMGVVYEGWDEIVGRKVAIKQLLPIRGGTADNAKDRLLQEARAAGSLLHPNIVSIYGVHFQNDMPVLVQQHVEGESLQDRINSKRYLSWQECVDVAKQIAAGLEAAHAAGIVHRDLKPDNILIEASTNIVRIADFGIAKQSAVTGLTVSDKIAGTPAYMSPEQTAGESLDARSDLFSLGSVLVAAVTGTPPFGLDAPFVVMDRIRTQDAKRLSILVPNCPAWLDEIVDRLLQKDRAKRIASASELSAAMQLQSLPRSKSNLSPSAKAMLVLGVGALAVLLFLSLMPKNGIKDPSKTDSQSVASTVGIESGENPSNNFVPSKPIWNRRDSSQFDSLADAIESASDGDVIEIGADLECDPITIRGKKLTLRGASQERPVLRSAIQTSNGSNFEAYFIRTESDLKLEGIEIDWITSAQVPFFDEKKMNAVVGAAPGTRLVIDQCKVVRSAGGVCLAVGGNLEMHGTCVEGGGIALAWLGHHSQVAIEDSVFESKMGIAIIYPLANVDVYARSNLKLRNCTIRALDAMGAMLARRPDDPVGIQMQDSILDTGHAISLVSLSVPVREMIESQPVPFLRSSVEWSEARCLYDDKCDFLITRRIRFAERANPTSVSSLEHWLALRSSEAESTIDGNVARTAKMTRIPATGAEDLLGTYHFESTSGIPLPSWTNKVGPRKDAMRYHR
jgi:serine/threonine-protein kinase